MNLKEYFPAFEAASQAMTHIYAQVLQERANSFGLSLAETQVFTQAPTFEPGPISAELLNTCSPYTAKTHFDAVLQILADKGMLSALDGRKYRLTYPGLEVIKELQAAEFSAISGIHLMPVTKIMDLASRVKELADTCLAAADPPGTWCIQHVRRLDPGRGAPMLVRIDQFIQELRAFHEDAHLAAWRGYESNAHAWDILTHLWVRAESFSSLRQALEPRQQPELATREAIDHLVSKGWVSQTGDLLQITAFGAEIRSTAENTTDRYYLEPFKKYPDAEHELTYALIEEYRRSIPSS